MNRWLTANKWLLGTAIAIACLLTVSNAPSVAAAGFSGFAGYFVGVSAATILLVYALQKLGLVRNRAEPAADDADASMPWPDETD